jgi:large subunit ribosomal protein L4
MISLPIQDTTGQNVGTYEFDPGELASEINKQLLHDVVVMYETNERQGTVQTKNRGDVKGCKKKLYKQKGTGRARMGNKRTPMRRGGGHAWGKRPVDWTYRLPKKAIALATRMAILSKFQDKEVTILSEFKLSEPKTRNVVGVLKALGLADDSCLLTTETLDRDVWLAARNIPDVAVSPASELNAYKVLRRKRLVLTKSAMDKIRNRVNQN